MECESSDRKVAYYYDEEIGTHLYVQLGQYHPLKPMRTQMTDELIEVYGMKTKLKEFDSTFYGNENIDFTKFHSEDYINLIKNVKKTNKQKYNDLLFECSFGDDCPIMETNLYEYC